MTRLTIAANIYFRFLIVNLLILALTSPFFVLFGPFDNIKRSVVGAIMTSRHPQYITWLFSEQEIKSILGEINPDNQPKQDLLRFTKREDTSLRLVTINANRFTGYLLEIPDPTRIKAATARDIQEKGDTTSTIAMSNNAVAAINAGGFHDPNGTGTGRLPYGIIVNLLILALTSPFFFFFFPFDNVKLFVFGAMMTSRHLLYITFLFL